MNKCLLGSEGCSILHSELERTTVRKQIPCNLGGVMNDESYFMEVYSKEDVERLGLKGVEVGEEIKLVVIKSEEGLVRFGFKRKVENNN